MQEWKRPGIGSFTTVLDLEDNSGTKLCVRRFGLNTTALESIPENDGPLSESLLKPRPHQQLCRNNIVECQKSN